jgi:hypothetical protein
MTTAIAIDPRAQPLRLNRATRVEMIKRKHVA